MIAGVRLQESFLAPEKRTALYGATPSTELFSRLVRPIELLVVTAPLLYHIPRIRQYPAWARLPTAGDSCAKIATGRQSGVSALPKRPLLSDRPWQDSTGAMGKNERATPEGEFRA